MAFFSVYNMLHTKYYSILCGNQIPSRPRIKVLAEDAAAEAMGAASGSRVT